ncbi:MAG: energy transducer TonB [Bacteroidota bacterium]|jgi:hypothetical protein
MTKTFIIFLLTISVDIFSQTSTVKIKKEKQPQTVILRDRSAFFKDSADMDGLFISDFIKTNIRLPDSVSNRQILGKVFISFTIKETGELTNIEIVKGIKGCLSCDKEAVRLFSIMPKWTPAIIRNKPVATVHNWTVVFKPKE